MPHYFLRSMKNEDRTTWRNGQLFVCLTTSAAHTKRMQKTISQRPFVSVDTLTLGCSCCCSQAVRSCRYKFGITRTRSQAPAAIANTGAMLARWTNDFWTATNHCFMAESEIQASTSRHSIVLFLNPRGNTMIHTDASFLKGSEKQSTIRLQQMSICP